MSPRENIETLNASSASDRETSRREIAATWIVFALFIPLVAAWWLWAEALIDHLVVVAGFVIAAIAAKRIERWARGKSG